MYMHEPEEDFSDLTLNAGSGIALAISLGLTFYLGLFPSRVLEWASDSAISAFTLLR
jgi:NADH:ubiquinone oxidoreductase subunit 2 (subunit N)